LSTPPRARTLFGLILALVTLLSVSLPAASYYVEPLTGDGVDPVLLGTVQKLVSQTVLDSGNSLVAHQNEAEFTLNAELLKLGSATIMTMTKWSGGPGSYKMAYTAKMKAEAVEDLDEVSGRVTRAVVYERSPVELNNDLDGRPAAPGEQDDGSIHARNAFSFGLGPYMLENLNLPNSANTLAYSLNFGNQWAVSPQATLNIDYEIAWIDSASLYDILIGTCYYFGTNVTAPFVGLSLGYGGATSAPGVDNDPYGDGSPSTSVFGYCVEAKAGVLFFRDAKVNLSLQLRYLAIFANNGIGYPSSTGLVLELSR
jgi:hypothetical protein